MTNKEIIFNASQELAKQGVLNYTGRTIEVEMTDGSVVTVPEVEEIHTYAKWKEMGYQVQKGQKAVAQFSIWKYTSKRNEETNEEENAKMFMKMASFFRAEQVEKIA